MMYLLDGGDEESHWEEIRMVRFPLSTFPHSPVDATSFRSSQNLIQIKVEAAGCGTDPSLEIGPVKARRYEFCRQSEGN